MKKVIVFGAQGKMGREIIALLNKEKIVVENELNQTTHPDVIIDFTSPEGLLISLKWAQENKIPFVSGTTGLKEEHFLEMEKAAKIIPLFWSPNMSLGIAVLKKALSVFRHLSGFDFQIEEFHHNQKKDKPSGTALFLQSELKNQVGHMKGIEIPDPISIRGGGIFGVHKIFAMSPEEVIVFEHSALNRTVFAKGAVMSARWITDQKPGRYSMEDLIKDMGGPNN